MCKRYRYLRERGGRSKNRVRAESRGENGHKMLGVTTKQDIPASSDILLDTLQHLHIGLSLYPTYLEGHFPLYLGTSIHERKGEVRQIKQACRT